MGKEKYSEINKSKKKYSEINKLNEKIAASTKELKTSLEKLKKKFEEMCACSNNETLQLFKEEQKNVVEQVIPNIIQKLNLDHTIREFKPKVGFSETFKFLKEFREQLKSISTMMKLCLQKENKEKTLELTLTAFNSYMINKYFKKIDILKSKKASVVLLEENLKNLVKLMTEKMKNDKQLVELMTEKMKNDKQMVLSALITYNNDNIRKIK